MHHKAEYLNAFGVTHGQNAFQANPYLSGPRLILKVKGEGEMRKVHVHDSVGCLILMSGCVYAQPGRKETISAEGRVEDRPTDLRCSSWSFLRIPFGKGSGEVFRVIIANTSGTRKNQPHP